MDIFLNWVLLGIILLIGIFGNLVGLIVFSKSRSAKFAARIIHIGLSLVDTIFLLFNVIRKFLANENIIVMNFSKLSCKISYYVGYFLSPISAWLLVFISLHRFISIAFQRVAILNKPRFQIGFIIAVIVYNLILYSLILIFISLENEDNGNASLEFKCKFNKTDMETDIYIIDLMNAVVLPFLLMLILSVLLIWKIFKSRFRIIRITNQRDKSKLKKDIQFSICSVLLNLIFFLLNFPVCIVDLVHVSGNLRDYFFCMYLFSFCINFYVLFFFNSLFFNEVLKLFLLKKS